MNANALRHTLPSALLLSALSMFANAAFGQGAWAPPAADKRCPSKWGAADQRGAANLMTPETVMRATRLVKEGRVFELGKVLEAAIPKFGQRIWALNTQRSSGPGGRNQVSGNEEVVVTELGQVGTQFDALPHIGIGEDLYNCNKTSAIATRSGFTRLGVENVGALMSRGVMLDVAALKGMEILPAGYEITVTDLEAAIQKQGTPIGKADVVLVRTGWGRHYVTNNATFNSGQPGIGIAAAEWLAAKDIMLVGSDNWGIEVFPNPDKDLRFPVHQIMLTVNGIYQIENMNLEDLSREKVYEFAFVVQPLKIKGGTGSTVAPIAIR
jgi:kynurenine formamidase